MKIKQAYNIWANQYDLNENKTRDLEAFAIRSVLGNLACVNCLEIGCGTGKNTEWLISKAATILAVDLSEEMLSNAKKKIQSNKVKFILADINEDWNFINDEKFDLVTFSLVLEHIENLDRVFEKLSSVINENGHVYIGELHPFKQYNGTKAHFETENGVQIVPCFNHHISDFTSLAIRNGFQIVEVNEYFDDHNRSNIPRILTLLLRRNS